MPHNPFPSLPPPLCAHQKDNKTPKPTVAINRQAACLHAPPLVTVKSRIFCPSNMGSSWLRTNTTPHMNAVNQMAVCWLGWYFRMTIGCGTGRSLAKKGRAWKREREREAPARRGAERISNQDVGTSVVYQQNAMFRLLYNLPLRLVLPCLRCYLEMKLVGQDGCGGCCTAVRVPRMASCVGDQAKSTPKCKDQHLRKLRDPNKLSTPLRHQTPRLGPRLKTPTQHLTRETAEIEPQATTTFFAHPTIVVLLTNSTMVFSSKPFASWHISSTCFETRPYDTVRLADDSGWS